MTIGEKIKQLRKALGITQLELAGDRFTKGYISQIENDIVKPTINVLQVISEKLNKPISYFLEEENNPSYEDLENGFIKGENLFHQREYDKALEIFQKIFAKYNHIKHILVPHSKLYQGKCYLQLNQYNRTLETLLGIIDELVSYESYEKAVEAYFTIGLAYFNLVEYHKAIKWFHKTLSLVEDKGLDMNNHKAKLYLNIATANSNLGRWKTALQYFEYNLIHCQKHSVLDTLLDTHVRIGYIQYKLGEYQASKLHLSRAVGINQALRLDMIRMEIFNILGLLISKEGKIPQGIHLLQKSMLLCETNGWIEPYYLNVIDWISILIHIKDYEQAKALASKHENSIASTNNQRLISLFNGQMGKLLYFVGDLRGSIKYLTTAVESLLAVNMKWETSEYARILADLLFAQAPEKAQYYYRMSIDCLNEINQ